MVVALSRFGTFSNLGLIKSSPSDVYPNTSTFTFYGSSYTSKYLTFTPKEVESTKATGNGYAQLETLTSEEQKLFSKYTNGFPFLDLGGKYVVKGPQFTPDVLKGLDQQQIAAQLADPSSAVAKSINGSANLLTAAICKMTSNQPTAVCSSPAIQALAGRLGG
jgi:hypothetical protein